MQKWLRAVIPMAAVLVTVLLPRTAMAATSAQVTVTASGFVCDAPGGLTLTYISDYEVGISWVKGANAAKTMIRAAYGRVPSSRTDGYLVYYDIGTSTSDTGVSLDETATPVYYRAWSQNAGGGWEDTGASDFIEGVGVTLLAFVVLCVALSWLGSRSLYYILKFMAGVSWWVFGVFWIGNPPSMVTKGSSTDIAVLLLLFGIGVAFMLMPFWYPKYENGRETSGGFRIRMPRILGGRGEEEEMPEPPKPTRAERLTTYQSRVEAALRGNTRRRR